MNLFGTTGLRSASLAVMYLTFTAMTPVTARAQSKSVVAAAPQKAGAVDEIVVEEIVVTATRRNLKLSDTPLSISALSQDALATLGVRDSKDIAYVVPGLSVISDNSGGDSISIRGVVAIGSTPTTSFYIDETPISQTGGGYFSPRYFDIERVEVLRGPQGTLFGASSMGGGIRVITKRPNLNNVEGALRGEGSSTRLGGGNYTAEGAVSVPIINDVLALRVTGFYEKQAGWTKAFNPVFSNDPFDYLVIDPDTGAPVSVGVAYKGFTGAGKRIGDQTIYGGRASLLFQPVDTLKITATYHRQQRNNAGNNIADTSVGLGLVGTELRQARAFPGYRNRLSQLANITADLDVGFAKLISSTSYQWGRENRLVDFSATLVPFGVVELLKQEIAAVPRDANGQIGSAFFSQQKTNDFTQEIRLVSSSDGPLNWIVGGFYNKSKNLQDQDVQLRGITAFFGIPNDSYIFTLSDDRLKETSFFGEAGYKFSDTLSANFGIRHYNIEIRSNSSGIGLVTGGVTQATPPTNVNEDGFTYKAGLKYKPSDNLMVFANYTTGYRPGGANTPGVGVSIPLQFTSDKLAQYEVGLKSNWLDRALSVNGAVFYIDWSSIPTAVSTPSGFGYTINGPKARNYGAELELTMRPTKGLDVSVGITALSAKYAADFNDLSGTAIVIKKGDRLPNVPDITLNAALNYAWSIGRDTSARIGANISHVTKRSQSANDKKPLLPGLINAGLSAGINFGNYDISMFVRNVFDSRALVGNFAIGTEIANGTASTLGSLSYIQPRTIGASAQIKF